MLELLIIIGVIAVIAYLWYVTLVTKRNKALEALSGIDVQLKKRADLIPNIVTVARKYMEHERELFEEVTRLRSKVTEPYDKTDNAAVSEHLKAAELLSGHMGKLMIAVENYPDMKSDQSVLQAQQAWSEVEGHISAARRFYNSAVTALNNAVQIFPGSLIANAASIEAMPYYEAEEAVHNTPDAKTLL